MHNEDAYIETTTAEGEDGSLQFTYSGGTGPNMWGKINPNFSTCGNGKWQSPINIWTGKAVLNKKLKPLLRSYPSCNVTLVNNKFNVGVKYPDHTYSGGGGGILEVDGKEFKLKQMHWHSPSEHRINGKQYVVVTFNPLFSIHFHLFIYLFMILGFGDTYIQILYNTIQYNTGLLQSFI